MKFKIVIENRDGIPGNTAVFYANSEEAAKEIKYMECLPHDHQETTPIATIEENKDGRV